jgi:AmmeMemoRadiSam system protein A
MSPLPNDEKRSLLQIARSAIESVLTHGKAAKIPSPSGNLAIPSGAFVTLHRNGRLRGCIGRVIAVEPLAYVVADCAVAAATSDPRFSRLHLAELHELQIEISVLSCPQEVSGEDVQPGIHGVIISRGENRGILLPQVAADHGWARERFLEETCEKAGLPPDAWRDPATRIEVFTAEVFSDSDFPPQTPSDDRSPARSDFYSSSQ